jgi:hypothetical protein
VTGIDDKAGWDFCGGSLFYTLADACRTSAACGRIFKRKKGSNVPELEIA